MLDTQIILDTLEKHQNKTEENFDKIRQEVNEKFEKVNNSIVSFGKKNVELEIHLKEAKEDIDKFEKILHGNGAPGLKVQVEMLDKTLENFKENLKSFNEQKLEKDKQLTNKKMGRERNDTAIKVALITSLLSFSAMMVKIFVDIFIL